MLVENLNVIKSSRKRDERVVCTVLKVSTNALSVELIAKLMVLTDLLLIATKEEVGYRRGEADMESTKDITMILTPG